MSDLLINPYSSDLFSQVRGVYLSAFEGDTSNEEWWDIFGLLSPSNCIVAQMGRNVVGFNTYVRLGDLQDDNDLILQLNLLTQCCESDSTAALNMLRMNLQFYSSYVNKGKITLNRFENALSIDLPELGEDDIYLHTIGVDQNHQRRRVGTHLIERILEIHIQENQTFYIECEGESGSKELVEKFGFLPLLEYGPVNELGKFATLMGYRREIARR